MANYYLRWIGDIQKDTGHLSCAELGVYDRLLDHYYASEQPLPADLDACARIARAMTKDERKAVDSVLRQFFAVGDDGYTQKRADEEITKLQLQRAAKQTNGKAGGRPRKTLAETKEKPSRFPLANLEETYSESSPTPTPFLVSINQADSTCARSDLVERFSMHTDWLPDDEFTGQLQNSGHHQPWINHLDEFCLYWAGRPEERNNHFGWQNKFLKNIIAKETRREANLA